MAGGGGEGNKNPSEKVTFKMITRNGGEFQRERESFMGKAPEIWTRLRKQKVSCKNRIVNRKNSARGKAEFGIG